MSPGTNPTPDIKANGSDESITIGKGSSLSIKISLDAGSSLGVDCGLWIVTSTPSGEWQYFDLSLGDYTPGLMPSLTGFSLVDFGSTVIFNTSGLGLGTYTYYFAVDLGGGQLFFDSVVVTVKAGEISAPTGFTASASGSTVTLNWNVVSGADGYKLYYGYSSGNYAGSVNLGNTTIQVISDVPDGTYYLAIKAYVGSNESGYSDEVSITVESTKTVNWNGSWSCDGLVGGVPIGTCGVSGGSLSLSLIDNMTFGWPNMSWHGTVTFSGSPCGLPSMDIDGSLMMDDTIRFAVINGEFMVGITIFNYSITSMSGRYDIYNQMTFCINTGTISLNK